MGGLLRLVQQGSDRMNAVANAAADKWPSSSGFCTGTKRHTNSFSGTHKTTRKAHTTCFKKTDALFMGTKNELILITVVRKILKIVT